MFLNVHSEGDMADILYLSAISGVGIFIKRILGVVYVVIYDDPGYVTTL
jgi:hypothetical protein